MKTYELTAPCHFGLEAVLKREIYDLGYEITRVENGRVSFSGDAEAIALANIHLRTAERVFLKVGEFEAVTFDDFFNHIEALPWENYIPADGKFWVTKAASVKSQLFSTSDLQSLAKKAMAKRLGAAYGMDWLPETGAPYPVRIFFMNDVAEVFLDTTGTSLHKRGYRKLEGEAPISETLAAALIMLTPWHADRILLDPFCGSGTIPIEAAMIAANIAPGLQRSFTAEQWGNIIHKDIWSSARADAYAAIDTSVETDIQGYDIDDDVVKIARANAEAAGVDDMIHFQRRAVADASHPKKYGFIVTNPPYGERLTEGGGGLDLPALYRQIGEAYRGLDSWSMYLITSYEDAEKYIGAKADKNRKIYNGMIKTYFYQYLGPKPPKRKRE